MSLYDPDSGVLTCKIRLKERTKTMNSQAHKFVEAMERDVATEKLTQGDTQRCWIGCAIEEYDHHEMAYALQWPLALVRIGENIFEGMSKTDAQAFAVDILAAPKPGADLSLVQWKFLHWVVKDALEKYATKETRSANKKNIAVLRDLAKGVNVSAARRLDARVAAHAHAHAGAHAHAHARAAYAAYAAHTADAAAAAAHTADAAAAAAYAADAAYAAYARKTCFKRFGDKLIEFMKDAQRNQNDEPTST